MRQNAFTLVELSIVLVILGLLIGGVLTGQSLIRAAELRAVTMDFHRYTAAVHTFRDKYFAIPGDMTNATRYWGQAASGSTCYSTASTDALTCNGDGDGQLQSVTGNSNEVFRFWQHLANAGLIEGSYNGITAGSNSFAASKANSPSGKINSSLWYASWYGNRLNDSSMFDGSYGNSFQFGLMGTNTTPSNALLKPEDTYNIDMKLDDGKPATGKMVLRIGTGLSPCTTTSDTSVLTASYNLSNTSLACAPIFRQLF